MSGPPALRVTSDSGAISDIYTHHSYTKTAAEASKYGGTAGIPHDPCYHQSCDDLDNLDEDLFLMLSRAAAYTTWELANTDGWGRRSATHAVQPLFLTPRKGTSCSGGSAHPGASGDAPRDR